MKPFRTPRRILSYPKDRIVTSPVLCTKSIVVTVMPAMLLKQEGHSRTICQSTAGSGEDGFLSSVGSQARVS